MKQTFYTVAQFCEHNHLTQGTVRMWIFNAEKNAFKKCIYRIGRRILISQEKFCDWMEGNPDSEDNLNEKMVGEKLIREFLKLNQEILVLDDKNLGELFEVGTHARSVRDQRVFTAGMIEGLEHVLGLEDMAGSISNLKMMIKERVE